MSAAIDLSLGVGGKLNADSVGHFLRTSDRADCLIDLGGLLFAEPAGLVSVAVLAESQLRLGRPVEVRGPRDPSVRNYVDRMRLGLVLADMGAAHDLSGVNERPLGASLLELQRFEGKQQAASLAGTVFELLQQRDEELAVAMHDSIYEIGLNVPIHSGLTHGYVAAQTTYNGRVVHFAVGDSGRGFKQSLVSRGATDDADALARALDGVSSSPVGRAGRGVKKTRDLILENGGSFFLATGEADMTVATSTTTRRRSVAPEGCVLQGAMRCA